MIEQVRGLLIQYSLPYRDSHFTMAVELDDSLEDLKAMERGIEMFKQCRPDATIHEYSCLPMLLGKVTPTPQIQTTYKKGERRILARRNAKRTRRNVKDVK